MALRPVGLESVAGTRMLSRPGMFSAILAVRILLYSGTEFGNLLGIKRSAASHAVHRGGEILIEQPELVKKIFRVLLNN
jgi:hypothetical protein